MSGIESNFETVEPELIISNEQKEILMNYLINSSDSALTEDLEVPNENEEKLAEYLLSLNLPSGDVANPRHAIFSDSNYKPDVESRDNAFEEARIEGYQNIKIVRHDIAFDLIKEGQNYTLPLKIINLTHQVENQDDGPDTQTENIPGGIIFVGKITFTDEGESRYVKLTELEAEDVKNFILNKNKK